MGCYSRAQAPWGWYLHPGPMPQAYTSTFFFPKTRIALSAAGEEVSSPTKGSSLPPWGVPVTSFCACGGVVKTPATVKDLTAFPAGVTLFFPSSSKCGVDAVAQGFIDHSRSATQILSVWVGYLPRRPSRWSGNGRGAHPMLSVLTRDGEPLGWVAPCL